MNIQIKVQDGVRTGAFYNIQISEVATLDVLHKECVKHANEHGSGYTVKNTRLELQGMLERYAEVFPTDELVLKSVGPKTPRRSASFKDGADKPSTAPHSEADTSYSSPRSHQKSSSFEIKNDVFVRWVTVTRALEYKKLSDIPYDIALERSTPLSKLKMHARDWLRFRQDSSSLEVECYLTNCYLSAREGNRTTLEELGLTGSLHKPLNIFVVLKPSARNAKKMLEVLEILNKQPEKLHGLPEILLKVTHFPPVLLTLEELQDSRNDSSNDGKSSILLAQAVVIDCLVELAIRIIPDLSSEENPRVAAIARLPCVIDWLLSQSSPRARSIVRSVRLQHPSDKNTKMFKYMKVVKLPDSVGAPADRDTVEVSYEPEDGIQPAFLAVALYPCYAPFLNYFLEDTPQTRAFLEGCQVLSHSINQDHAESQVGNTRQRKFTTGKEKKKMSTSLEDRFCSEDLWQEQQDTFEYKHDNKELQRLRDTVQQLRYELEESQLEGGTYRERCDSLKFENANLKERLKKSEETLRDVLG